LTAFSPAPTLLTRIMALSQLVSDDVVQDTPALTAAAAENSEVLVDNYKSFQYTPISSAESETPILSFSNLTVEYVAANAIESAATQALTLLRKSFRSGGEEAAVRSKKVILRKVSGELTSGFWGILGQSGSGKVCVPMFRSDVSLYHLIAVVLFVSRRLLY
jgi:hypothetical protein